MLRFIIRLCTKLSQSYMLLYLNLRYMLRLPQGIVKHIGAGLLSEL